jgi:hypothetical protein
MYSQHAGELREQHHAVALGVQPLKQPVQHL